MSQLTLEAFLPGNNSWFGKETVGAKSWFDGPTMPWEEKSEPVMQVEEAAPEEPGFVTVASGQKIAVRDDRQPLTYDRIQNIVLAKVAELKRAIDKVDDLVNNQVGNQNNRQKKKSRSQQAESLAVLKRTLNYWSGVAKELEHAEDYLGVYHKKIRGLGYSKEVVAILADLQKV
jgi:hypothetical protein